MATEYTLDDLQKMGAVPVQEKEYTLEELKNMNSQGVPLQTKIGEFGKGLVKSGISTVKGALTQPSQLGSIISPIASKIAPFTLLGRAGTDIVSGGTDLANKLGQKIPEQYVTPNNPEQQAGFTTGEIGQIIAPSGLGLEKAAVKTLPKILSFTADIPEKVLIKNLTNPSEMKSALQLAKQGQGEEVLKKVQGAVKDLRSTISKEYQEGKDYIINKFQDKNISLDNRNKTLLDKANNDFSLQNLPKELDNITSSEALDLYKEVNELYSKPFIQKSAQGHSLRELRNSLQNTLKNEFGIDFENLNKNYSGKKQILDAADSLVKAYQTNKPIVQSTALARLKMVYRDNKGAYLQAIQDLEKQTGINLTDYVSALQQVPVFAKPGFSVSPLVKKADIILRSLLFPITSPRFVSSLMRGLGKTEKVLKKVNL